MVFNFFFDNNKKFNDILGNVKYCFFVDSDMIDDTDYVFRVLFPKKNL